MTAHRAAPRLSYYDVLLVNTSGGKDSQAMLDVLASAAAEEGVLDRLVAVHADLGRVEWPGTRELAAEHAAHYGVRLEVVRNRNWADLLERIEARGRSRTRRAGGARPTSSARRSTRCSPGSWRSDGAQTAASPARTAVSSGGRSAS